MIRHQEIACMYQSDDYGMAHGSDCESTEKICIDLVANEALSLPLDRLPAFKCSKIGAEALIMWTCISRRFDCQTGTDLGLTIPAGRGGLTNKSV
jgi:hypothetical protein